MRKGKILAAVVLLCGLISVLVWWGGQKKILIKPVSDRPIGEKFVIVDMTGVEGREYQAQEFPILNGCVDLGWGYGERGDEHVILYKIMGEEGPSVSGEMSLSLYGRTVLNIDPK